MTTVPQRLVVDRGACAGHGLCYGSAPDLIDSDELGDPVIQVDPIPPSQLETARKATAVCPERALSLTNAESPDSEEPPR
ncbi:ferredoxin [Nocardia sp. NPDC004860]|uniref:ferredoxin n=1 Tax=Nocardia sp. NPDC004860 TaxID=3154557 RepID=UPI0033ADCA2C